MPDSFYETDLHEELKAKQIQNLVIAGSQTEYCVNITSRRACGLGYHVILVQDDTEHWIPLP